MHFLQCFHTGLHKAVAHAVGSSCLCKDNILSEFPVIFHIFKLLFLRCRNIMKVAQAKLEMIKPDEVNMEEYEVSISYALN